MTLNATQPVVEIKRRWGDPWQWIPWLYVRSYDRCLAPTLGTCRLTWNYGRIQRAGSVMEQTVKPFLTGKGLWWVRVRDWSEAGVVKTVWIGRLESISDQCGDATRAAGDEESVAYSAESVLTRTPVTGSYFLASDGYALVPVDELLPFNQSGRNGNQIVGNRSAKRAFTRTYVFSYTDGCVWTAADALEYLLERHGPAGLGLEASGNGMDNLSVLDGVWPQSSTLAASIAALIDRRRGAAWFVEETAAGGGLALRVVSTLDDAAGGLSANGDRFDLDTDHDETVSDLVVQDNSSARYDRVEVLGGPIVHCGTFSTADGTLSPGWHPDLETEYRAAIATVSKNAPADSRFEYLYRRFLVPMTWDRRLALGERGNDHDSTAFGPASWTCGYDGKLTPDRGGIFRQGRPFLRQLPLREGFSYESTTPYASDPVAGAEAFERPMVWARGTLGEEKVWTPIDQPSSLGGQTVKSPGCHVRLLDDFYGMVLESPYPHFLSAGDKDLPAREGMPAAFDWEHAIAATMAYTNGHRIMVGRDLGGGFPPCQPKQTLRISVPDSEAWVLLPYTAVGCQEGKLVYCKSGMILRNDVERLKTVLDLAAAWYANPRSAATVHYGVVEPRRCNGGRFRLGAMLRVLTRRGERLFVGAVVSRVVVNVDRQTTSVQTDFAELDFVDLASRSTPHGRGPGGKRGR